MTITTETYAVRESAEHADVWDVLPATRGAGRHMIDVALCVAWCDPITDETGRVLWYEGLTWDYINADGGRDVVEP